MKKSFTESEFLNKRFGRLKVTDFKEAGELDRMATVIAVCDCGVVGKYQATKLKTGHTRSCGCIQREVVGSMMRTHGMANKNSIYSVWKNMRRRCNAKNSKSYYRYGGRGIRICKTWNSFTSFYDWAIKNGYKKELHLDRINNDGNYSYKNCRFVTPRENVLNSTVTRYIIYNGERRSLTDWAKIVGITTGSLHLRIDKYKWPIEKALTVRNLRKQKIK